MRILLINKPYYPVPPTHYGGVERIVDALARGLKARGHQVTLLARIDSTCPVGVVPWRTEESHSPIGRARSALEVIETIAPESFDLVHCHAAVSAVFLAALRGVPVVTTFHLPITMRTLRYVRVLGKSRMFFTAPSRTMISAARAEREVEYIPNFVEIDRFQFRATVSEDAPIVMMGRIDMEKGVHFGIEAARKAGRKLIIAGTIDPGSVRYFDRYVRPHIDNEKVRYVGPVDDRQKAKLLGAAAAFLLPAQWEEPFGIVMVEAMACGTPVIGFRRGEIPGIIVHGRTGFVAGDVDEMAVQIGRIGAIDRAQCRKEVERNYSSDLVIDRYIACYYSALANVARASASEEVVSGPSGG